MRQFANALRSQEVTQTVENRSIIERNFTVAPVRGFVASAVAVAAMTGFIALTPGADHTANVSLLYLLVVMGAAHWLGRAPAVGASLLAVISFDWFFVEPRHTLTVTDPAEWLALGVFLLTAIVISQLSALIRQRAQTDAQAQALAEADRLKTALLSMVSHDFRSPLTSIKTGVTALLQDGPAWDADSQRELLAGIDQEADRLNRMVGNILALSRLEADAWRPQCETVPLSELIGTALDGFSAADNQRIRVDIENAPFEAHLDMVQIVQVTHNLLENALKYSPPNSAVVLRATQSASHLVIEVLDEGAGLAPGEEKLVFERFYRAPQWRESSLPGTGIGLAVCSGLAHAHGGELSAFNRDQGGATFQLRLPMDAPQSARAHA